MLVNGEPVSFEQAGDVFVFRGARHRHGDRFLAIYDPAEAGGLPIAENGTRTVRYDSAQDRCFAEFAPFVIGDLEQTHG